MTLSSKHRIPFKPRRQGSSADLAGFSSRQGNRFIYTYDSMGRMLTRDDGTDLTQFTWDNWDCIKEVTGESETVYHIPEGQILSFVRDGVTYQAHSCALGSIRMITDEAGEVVARYDFDAWGRAISVTEDSALVGFPMRFVGSLGVRFDELSGMYYMRHRWFDSTSQRFISRDPIGLNGGANLYTYAGNNPVAATDHFGLRPANPAVDIGVPSNRYIPAMRTKKTDNPMWYPKADPPGLNIQPIPGLPLTRIRRPTPVRDVWNRLKSRAGCERNQRCYMICTMNIVPTVDNQPIFSHAFLVFGPTASDVYGLWQGNDIFKSDINISNWNANFFQQPDGMNLMCRMYCGDKSKVDQAEKTAQEPIPSGYTYIVGESNVWVNLVLQSGGLNWPGYDIQNPSP